MSFWTASDQRRKFADAIAREAEELACCEPLRLQAWALSRIGNCKQELPLDEGEVALLQQIADLAGEYIQQEKAIMFVIFGKIVF